MKWEFFAVCVSVFLHTLHRKPVGERARTRALRHVSHLAVWGGLNGSLKDWLETKKTVGTPAASTSTASNQREFPTSPLPSPRPQLKNKGKGVRWHGKCCSQGSHLGLTEREPEMEPTAAWLGGVLAWQGGYVLTFASLCSPKDFPCCVLAE